MPRKPPTGPHADVAERFGFLLDSLDLDRSAFAAAVDGAVTPRSLYAILSGDRRPSRALAVLVERTFGFRAAFLLDGTGTMWVRSARALAPSPDTDADADLTPTEQRVVDFARRSIDNARRLDDEVTRAETWERLWERAQTLLEELERTAVDEPTGYARTARATLETCWSMAEAFAAWTRAIDEQRTLNLTRMFAHRYLVQVPREVGDSAPGTGPNDGGTDGIAAMLGRLEARSVALQDKVDRLQHHLEALATPQSVTTNELDLLVRRIEDVSSGRSGYRSSSLHI